MRVNGLHQSTKADTISIAQKLEHIDGLVQAIRLSEDESKSNGEDNKTLRSTLGQTETMLMYVMGGFIIGSISTVVALIFLN